MKSMVVHGRSKQGTITQTRLVDQGHGNLVREQSVPIPCLGLLLESGLWRMLEFRKLDGLDSLLVLFQGDGSVTFSLLFWSPLSLRSEP